MSFYELDRPAPSTIDRIGASPMGAALARLRAAGSSWMTSIAYARMMRAMYEMDDATLARIGVARADIPAYVEKCLRGR